MASGGDFRNLVSTNVEGDHNIIHNTIHSTVNIYNMDSTASMRPTGSSQPSSTSSGASHVGSLRRADSVSELITDETKRNAEVKEIEISWLAKEVARSDKFYSKKENLYRYLSIPNQEIGRIKLERLERKCSIEDEVFKVINIGWLQKPPTKARSRLLKQLSTFTKSLAQAYAEYINNCDNFDIGLPLPLPGSVNSCRSLSTLPSVEGPSATLSLQSLEDITSLALRNLSIQAPTSVDGCQVVESNSLPSLHIQLGNDVEESEITWLSERVANGHSWKKDSFYRHLSIPDHEIERIKYEKLDEDRNIENEIFKVVYHGWYIQGMHRTRALLYRQLYTFHISLAEEYIRFVMDQSEEIVGGQ